MWGSPCVKSYVLLVRVGTSLFCFFLPIFLSRNSFFLTYYAQYFAHQQFNLLAQRITVTIRKYNTCTHSRHPWQNNFPDATVKGSLGYSVTLCWGFIVLGLLCEFVLFALLFPGQLVRDFWRFFAYDYKSDTVGAFSTLSNETALDLDVDEDELLALSRQVLLLVELDEEFAIISDSCDNSQYIVIIFTSVVKIILYYTQIALSTRFTLNIL